MKAVQFNYKNHRGEVALRTVIPDSVEFLTAGSPDYGYRPGWFLSGYDVDKGARRSFALTNIILDEHNRLAAGQRLNADIIKIRLED